MMNRIKNLSAINTNTIEGRYLIAAIAKITSESQRDKEPDEVLEQCHLLQEEIYKYATPIPDDVAQERPTFEVALTNLINRYSKENDSNTPDFILSQYLYMCLDNFNFATNEREKWYGRKEKMVPLEKKKLLKDQIMLWDGTPESAVAIHRWSDGMATLRTRIYGPNGATWEDHKNPVMSVNYGPSGHGIVEIGDVIVMPRMDNLIPGLGLRWGYIKAVELSEYKII